MRREVRRGDNRKGCPMRKRVAHMVQGRGAADQSWQLSGRALAYRIIVLDVEA